MVHRTQVNKRSTRELVEAYVLSRREAKFLSTDLAIRAIRTLSPASDISDRELENMIETTALEHGVSVSLLREVQSSNG
jgi:hypothetical protein